MTATTQALLVTGVLLCMSLASAYITLVLMRGTAQVVHKGVRLGGATGMFVVTFLLLSQFLPEIRDGLISEAEAAPQTIDISEQYLEAEPVSFSIAPKSQATTIVDLRRLSRNEYIVDEDFGLAIARPKDNSWEAGRFNEGIPSIDLSQIPLFSMGIASMKSMADSDEFETPLFGVRSAKTYDITLHKDSIVDGIKIGVNPFEDESFVNSLIEAQLDAGSQLMVADDKDKAQVESQRALAKELFKMAIPEMISGYRKLIEKTFPKSVTIRSGVFVTPLTSNQLMPEESSFAHSFLRNATLLDLALEYLTLNSMIGAVASNIQLDQRQGVMSYDGTVKLENVKLDGTITNLSIHHIGFVVAGSERAVSVSLIYFDTGKEGIRTLTTLQEFLKSLRFVS